MLSSSETQTFEIARVLVDEVHESLGHQAIIFAISGSLGAGKTRLTKGIAASLGILDTIISPTYVLETEYRIPKSELKFVHLDAYRLETVEELSRLGLDRRVKNKCVIVLEWADKFDGFLNQFAGLAKIVNIAISPGKTDLEREINWKIL